jgi:uncharacterized repeat protein (TIGR01451 family)
MKTSVARLVAQLIVISVLLLLCPVISRGQFPWEQCSPTEAWAPVGVGLPIATGVFTSVVWNDKLYALQGDDTLSRLWAWDGNAWTLVSKFAMRTTHAVPINLQVYHDKLYMAGKFNAVNNISTTGGIAVWDGKSWRALPPDSMVNTTWQGTYGFPAYAMAEYRGELIVTGDFMRSGDLAHYTAVKAWNGTSWRTLAETQDFRDSLTVASFVVWHGDLYACGPFSKIGGVAMQGVARWDGTRWSAVGSEDMRWGKHLFVFKDELYLVRDNLKNNTEEFLNRWDGAHWQPVPGVLPKPVLPRGFLWSTLGRGSVAVHDGKVYFHFNYGPLSQIGVQWDGVTARHLAQLDDDVRSLIEYRGDLYASGDFLWSCGGRLQYVARLCTDPGCYGISGRVVDALPGSDCQGLEGMPGIGGRIVAITPGPRYALTYEDGSYYSYIDNPTPDIYTVGIAPKPHVRQVCPSGMPVRTVALNSMWDVSTGNDFGLVTDPGVNDVRVSLAGGRIRPGGVVSYTIACSNTGAVPVAECLVGFLPDSSLGFSQGYPEPDQHGLALSWRLADMAVGETRILTVEYHVPVALRADMIVCATASASIPDDADPTDNIDSACVTVTASFDPNDISVAPPGKDDFGTIGAHDSVLTYTVRFQNTGTDTAFRVVVIDTLSPNLDLPSLVLGAASHPFKLRLVENGGLAWEFADIRLPDSATSLAGSQGYFKYSVRLKPGLAPSTRIGNRAGIYFDFNKPVITNTVISSIPSPSSVEREPVAPAAITIYPNPTRGMAYLRGKIARGSTVEVRDMLGRVVRSVRYEGGGDVPVDLGGLGAGVYMISAGEAVARVMLVR